MWIFKYVANKFEIENFQTKIHKFTFMKYHTISFLGLIT
jgi:hypothetical protein